MCADQTALATRLQFSPAMRKTTSNAACPARVPEKEESVKRSRKSKQLISLLGLLLTLSLSLAFLAGCSSNATSPEEQIPADPKASWFEASAKADDAYSGPIIDLGLDVDFLSVGVSGGLLAFTVDGLAVSINVPTGAVSENVDITVDAKVVKTLLGPIYLFDFGPDGLVFNKPITLRQPMPAGQRYAFLYYFNPDTKVWELQQAVKVINGYASFSIYHFSKYGIS